MSYMQLHSTRINRVRILGIQDGNKRVLVDLHERLDLLCVETTACIIKCNITTTSVNL